MGFLWDSFGILAVSLRDPFKCCCFLRYIEPIIWSSRIPKRILRNLGDPWRSLSIPVDAYVILMGLSYDHLQFPSFINPFERFLRVILHSDPREGYLAGILQRDPSEECFHYSFPPSAPFCPLLFLLVGDCAWLTQPSANRWAANRWRGDAIYFRALATWPPFFSLLPRFIFFHDKKKKEKEKEKEKKEEE